MKVNTASIPARGKNLTNQIEAVKADVRAAADALAAAEAHQVASAADDAAFSEAKATVVAAKECLGAHQTRLDSLEKLQAMEDARECEALREHLHRRALRSEAAARELRTTVDAERRSELARHAAAMAVLEFRESDARLEADRAGRHANAANDIEDPNAMRTACADAARLDALCANPQFLASLVKRETARAHVARLVAPGSQAEPDEIEGARATMAAASADFDSFASEQRKLGKSIDAGLARPASL